MSEEIKIKHNPNFEHFRFDHVQIGVVNQGRLAVPHAKTQSDWICYLCGATSEGTFSDLLGHCKEKHPEKLNPEPPK